MNGSRPSKFLDGGDQLDDVDVAGEILGNRVDDGLDARLREGS